MTVNVKGSGVANAPREVVWDILADFGDIASWTDQVKTARLEGDKAHGVGAVRTCELAPFGSTHETITVWDEGESISLEVVPKKMPIRKSNTTFSLRDLGEGRTEINIATAAEPKGGIFKSMISRRLEKGLPKALNGLVNDLATAAEARTAAE